MINTVEARNSGYRFIPGVSQYSCGVAALPGFASSACGSPTRCCSGRLCTDRANPENAGGSSPAFVACELCSLAPFTEEGFKAFNEIYIKTLIEWGVMKDGVNLVGRSNVCPKIDPPAEPCFHAFSYAVPAPDAPKSFVIAGSGESAGRQGELPRPYRGPRRRLSPAGMPRRQMVLDEMERRMSAFGGTWKQTTGVQLIPHDVYAVLESELGRRGVFRNGLTLALQPPAGWTASTTIIAAACTSKGSRVNAWVVRAICEAHPANYQKAQVAHHESSCAALDSEAVEAGSVSSTPAGCERQCAATKSSGDVTLLLADRRDGWQVPRCITR